jgi:hypothetical protein
MFTHEPDFSGKRLGNVTWPGSILLELPFRTWTTWPNCHTQVVVITEGNEEGRRGEFQMFPTRWAADLTCSSVLNAKMRRIDLLCKLLGPLAISTISIASALIAIWATLAMNLISVVLEYVCIEQVPGHALGINTLPQHPAE